MAELPARSRVSIDLCVWSPIACLSRAYRSYLYIYTRTRALSISPSRMRVMYANWSRVAFIFNGSGVDRDDVDDDDDGDFAVIPSDRSSGFWLIID